MSSPSSNWIWLAGYLEISTDQHRIELRQALVLAGRCRESCEVLQEVLDRPDIGASWCVLGVRNQVGLDRSNYDAFWVWGFLSLVCLFWISIVSLFLQCMQTVSSSRWQEVLGRAVPCCGHSPSDFIRIDLWGFHAMAWASSVGTWAAQVSMRVWLTSKGGACCYKWTRSCL